MGSITRWIAFCGRIGCLTSGAPGCGLGTALNCFLGALIKSKLDRTRSQSFRASAVPGAWPVTVNMDSFHTTHGRAIPFATGLKAGESCTQGGSVLRRRRPHRHRRQPFHPRRAAQHGPDGDLRQQLYLRHDGRPACAHHADRGSPPARHPSAIAITRSTWPTWRPPAARLTWHVGRRCTCAGWSAPWPKRCSSTGFSFVESSAHVPRCMGD